MAEKSKSVKLLAAAIGFGLLAALLAVFYLKMREAALRAKLTPDDEKIQVVVANRDLAKGTVIAADPENFAVRAIPRDFVHTDAITAADLPQVEGKKLVENLAAGKALLRSFIDEDFPRDFSDTIPLRRRAMTVQVDEVNAVNGFIRPGNRIDILVTLPAGVAGDSSTDAVMPVLENVEVLATGRDSAREYEEKMMLIQGGVMNAAPVTNYSSITINVTPEEAALVETAQDKGDLLALLRNRKDTSGSGFTDVVPGDLLSNADKLAQQAAVRASAASIEKQGLVVGKDGKIRTKDGVVLKDQNLIVGADGTIRTKDGVILSGRGLTINEKGELVTADGKVVDSANLVVAADGTIMTKDGKILDGKKQPLLAAGKPLANQGLKVAADGTVRDKNGKLLEGVTVDKNGNVIKDGKLLAGVKIDANGNMVDETGKPAVVTETGVVMKGMTTDEHGQIVKAPDKPVANQGLKVAADGTVRDKNGKLLAGVTVDKNGNVMKDGKLLAGVRIDAKGNMVDETGKPVVLTESGVVMKGVTLDKNGQIARTTGKAVTSTGLKVAADGTVTDKSGKVLQGITVDKDGNVIKDGKILAGVKLDANGNMVDETGKPVVVTDSGIVLKGATTNDKGEIIMADGTVVAAEDLLVAADGTVTTKDGKTLSGLVADTSAADPISLVADAAAEADAEAGIEPAARGRYDFLAGGVSKDGVATVNSVPLAD